MAVQPDLFANLPEDGATPAPPRGATPAPPRGAAAQNPEQPQPASEAAPVWLQRISLFILVLFCVYLGVIVTLLPWWHAVWDHNLFFTSHPALWALLRTGPARGVVSGLGMLDIWIGISEAIHYREHRG